MNSRQDQSKHHKLLPQCFWILILLTAVFLGLAQFTLQYLGQEQISLIAIEAETGKVAWSVPLSDNDESLVRFTTAQADRVFVSVATDFDKYSNKYSVGGDRYQIQAFSAVSGQKLWTFSPTLSEPYRARDMALYLPLYAQGETLWLNLLLESVPEDPTSDPDIAAGQSKQQVAPLPNIRKGQVIAISTVTGQSQWTVDRDWNIDYPNRSGLASTSDRSVILRITPTQKIWLEAYQTATGEKLWQTQVTAPPKWKKVPSNLYRRYRLLANSDMIFLSNNETIEGYDWKVGKLKFQIKAEKLSVRLSSEVAVSGSTLYNHTLGRVEAFNSSTGIRRWSINLENPDRSECYFIEDINAVADGVYVVCGFSKLLFLDAQTGREKWVKQISDTVYHDGTSTGLKSFAALIEPLPYSSIRLVTFIRGSDRELWNWQPKYSIKYKSFYIK